MGLIFDLGMKSGTATLNLIEEEKKLGKNSLKKIREQRLLSKAELARNAGVSPLTIDRIEKGKSCRMETKRKILKALGFALVDAEKIFGQHEESRE